MNCGFFNLSTTRFIQLLDLLSQGNDGWDWMVLKGCHVDHCGLHNLKDRVNAHRLHALHTVLREKGLIARSEELPNHLVGFQLARQSTHINPRFRRGPWHGGSKAESQSQNELRSLSDNFCRLMCFNTIIIIKIYRNRLPISLIGNALSWYHPCSTTQEPASSKRSSGWKTLDAHHHGVLP